uniref:Uncharacterized protein n=2 Tax=Meloidogyne incognita group TaxID=654580 RepID=A0A915LH22_MELJA
MKEQTSEQEFAPLSKQNCLPVYEPSTSQTLEVLQSSNSSLPINNRNSLYHSLPLYWPKERKHKRSIGEEDKINSKSVFGLARLCGFNCTVNLKHGIDDNNSGESRISSQVLRITLKRVEQDEKEGIGKRKRRSTASDNQNWNPLSPFLLVQTMDSDNHTQISRSHISPACFYIAKIDDGNCFESSIVNLCDRNNGLFGTLAFSEGAFLIEPLIDEEDFEKAQEDNPNNYFDKSLGGGHPHHQRRKRRHRPHDNRDQVLLRAHLIYPVQTQYFGDDHNNDRRQHKSTEITALTSSEEFAAGFSKYSQTINANLSHYDSPKFPFLPVKRDRRSPATLANSWDHYVEVLIVADHQMLLYHQQNLENYVLTLFSTVSAIYRHQSLGISINMVVVRIIIIKNERAGPLISNRAQETLQQFCHWQQLYNDRNDDSLNHHDVAILLTRHDICRATNKCDTLGLAELGTLCDSKRSCAIIEDNAAFTIAHELGHIFNIPHDDERKCAEFMPLNKANYHIMAPTLEYNTNPWSWSACSSAMLARFLEARRSQTQCILDKPVERRYYERMFENPAPGEIYSVSQQCKFVFGAAAEICPYMPSCRRLWCAVSYGYQMGCRTQHMPWADGTECARQMWCYMGQCVGMSPTQRLPVEGSWGEWRSWGDCSRTCGGGIQKSYRDCDSPRPEHGGKYCTGQRVRYRTCAIHECPWDMPGIREQQCAEFDGKDIGIHGVPSVGTRWVPKFSGIAENERCLLYCRLSDSAAFYKLRDKVIDGTPCDRNVDDICIDGGCHKSGCDHRLGSDMRRDVCGICGGDGRTCREVKGVFNERGTFGYNEVLRIPAGAANIDITQNSLHQLRKEEDENYLALRMPNGDWLLNGQFHVSVFPQQIQILDTVLEYSGSDTPQERINGTGPLRTDVYLHFLSGRNLKLPNIHYRYMEPLPQISCTLKCQGTQTQLLQCLDTLTGKVLPDTMCATSRRPDPRQRICNVECFYKWQHRLLSYNGRGEKDRYQHQCVRSYTNGREEQASEDECKRSGIPLPTPPTRNHPQQQQINEQTPNKYVTDRRWAYTEWSVCSESCGTGGIRHRSIHCIDTRNGQKVENRFCEGIPHETLHTECNRTPCPRWVYEAWNECSRSCGSGIRIRHASCQDASGREVNARLCPSNKLDSEKCNEHLCTEWRFGAWSQCSVSCGQGIQRRDANCVDSNNRPLEDRNCDIREKIVVKQCELAPCPHWQLGSWSQCSISCGSDGFQTRLVQCVDSVGRKLPDIMCTQQKINEQTSINSKISENQKQQLRPQSHRICSPGPCPYWRTSDWNKCSVSCGQGIKKRLVECVLRNQIVDDSLCTEVNRPSHEEKCVLMSCAVWNVESWGPCSLSCGSGGTQHRNVNCVRYTTSRNYNNENNYIVLHDRECTGQKPQTNRICELPSCPIIKGEWVIGQWSECPLPKPCNANNEIVEQIRLIECRNNGELIEGDKFCSHLEKPYSRRSCPPCINIPKSESPKSDFKTSYTNPPALLHVSAAISLLGNQQKNIGKWITDEWSSCSASCGGGWRQRNIYCKNVDNVTTLKNCLESEKPIKLESCNTQKCPSGQWNVGHWSHCPNNCGSTKRTRIVRCIDPLTKAEIDHSRCLASERPETEHPCRHSYCPKWHKGEWGTCSTSCGPGFAKREVVCRKGVRNEHLLNDNDCIATEPRPPEIRKCNLKKCTLYSWRIGAWSKCLDVCKPGEQRRRIYCVNDIGKKASPEMCENGANTVKPIETRKCQTDKCPYYWVAGPWSSCSRSCDIGQQFRQIECRLRKDIISISNTNEDYTDTAKEISEPIVLSSMCMALENKPIVTQECEINSCNARFHWNAGPWSKCSKSCGPGFKRRKVRCLDKLGGRTTNSPDGGGCDLTTRPKRREPCFIRNCMPNDCAELKAHHQAKQINIDGNEKQLNDGNYTVMLNGYKITVYCHQMNETIPKTYLNLRPESNFAEFYGKRLAYPYSCPHNGLRNDSCACTNDGHVSQGFTRYNKVRIDLHNMKINPNDYTFAITEYGSPVAFGTAGDCYSMSDCPQGRFSIDLRGSDLRIVDDLEWVNQGHRTSVRIERFENNALIQGLCGGYCGECSPDRFKGLIIAVDNKIKNL